jgi:hypothetical protein
MQSTRCIFGAFLLFRCVSLHLPSLSFIHFCTSSVDRCTTISLEPTHDAHYARTSIHAAAERTVSRVW